MARYTQDSSTTNTHNYGEMSLLQLRFWREEAHAVKNKQAAHELGRGLASADADANQVSGQSAGTSMCFRTRLSREEIHRRTQSGLCTYCSGMGHVRSSCAIGRLMRRVSKGELIRRVRLNVCPLCGDPKNDRHTKQVCPRKEEMEREIRARREYSARADLPSAATVERSLQRVQDWVQRGGQVGSVPLECPLDAFEDDSEAEWMRTSKSSSSTAVETPEPGEVTGGACEGGKLLPPYPLEEDFLIDLRDY